MIAYFLVASISILFSLLYHLSDKKNMISQILLFCSFASLFVFSAIRYNVYTDYQYTYVREYYRIANGFTASHFEPLFYLLNRFVFVFFNNVDWLFIITSFIFILFVGKALKNKSVCIPLSIFLLFGSRMYFYSFDQIRQYIAIAIFLYNLKNVSERKFIPFVFWTIIGGLNHKLSFIFLPVYFINRLKLNRKQFVLVIIIIVALSPIYTTIFTNVAKYFYADYFNYGSFVNGTRINNSMVYVILSSFNILLSALYYNKLKDDKYYRILLNLQLVLLFIILGTWNLFDSYRIVAMFLSTSIILIPKIIFSEQNAKLRLFLLILVCTIYFISGITFIKKVSINYPYKTIFTR